MNAVEPLIAPGNRTQIETYLRHRLPFFVEGGPGIGKSLAVEYLGRLVYKEWCPTCRAGGDCPASCAPLKIDITEDTEVRHLLGDTDLIKYFADTQSGGLDGRAIADYFREGRLPEAMHSGRLLIVEELDRAGRETLFPVFFDAIEYRRTYIPELGKLIEAETDFNIVFTVNRFTDIGTVPLPKALLRRQRCVRFYDPSRELDHNMWQAAKYERDLVMRNVEKILGASNLDRTTASRLIFDMLVHVVFPLRASQAMSDPPTPAETALWFRDIFSVDGARFLDPAADPSARLEIALMCRGALIKAPADEDRLFAALAEYFA